MLKCDQAIQRRIISVELLISLSSMIKSEGSTYFKYDHTKNFA